MHDIEKIHGLSSWLLRHMLIEKIMHVRIKKEVTHFLITNQEKQDPSVIYKKIK